MEIERPPLLDQLTAQALACRVGIAAAERCAGMKELATFRADYERRAAHYRACLTLVEAQIAGVPLVTRLLWRVTTLVRRLGL